MTTPRDMGFRMPAEYAPHARTWMMWPCRDDIWPDINATKRAYARVAHAVRDAEPVTMLVRPEDATEARNLLGADIEIIETPLDDSWARDAGANFLLGKDGSKAATLFRFNAWGGKYAPFSADARVGDLMAHASGVTAFHSPLTAEGGGISVDGLGTIITTESCFPNANRNPDWTRDAIEAELCAMLGGDKVLWLPGNPVEIETDGHVDAIAVFAGPGHVVTEAPSDPDPTWRDWQARNAEALDGLTDCHQRALKITAIPGADAAAFTGPRFCGSYVNSYFVNDAVLIPRFGVPSDERAREIWQDIAPDRRIVQVDIADIALGGGGIHCITQQEPAARPI